MKLYIMTDLEGIAGVDERSMCGRNHPRYPEACRNLTDDVNAAVLGALDAGVDDIVVCDGHGGGGNLLQRDITPPARRVLPRSSTDYLHGMDETFCACFLIGGHAMAGTRQAFYPHTQHDGVWECYRINGRPTGEIGQVAAIAGHYGVPVVLVTADTAGAREAKEFLGDAIETVTVKHVDSNENIICRDLPEVHAAIRRSAKRALEKVNQIKPYQVQLPAAVTLKLTSPDWAQRVAHASGAKQMDSHTVGFAADSGRDVLGQLFYLDTWRKLENA